MEDRCGLATAAVLSDKQALPPRHVPVSRVDYHSEHVCFIYAQLCVCGLGGWFTRPRQKPPIPPNTLQEGHRHWGPSLGEVCILLRVWLHVCVCSLDRNPNQHMKGVHPSVAASPGALTGNRRRWRCTISPRLNFRLAAEI